MGATPTPGYRVSARLSPVIFPIRTRNSPPQFPQGSIQPDDFRQLLGASAFAAGTLGQQIFDTMLARSLDRVPAPSEEARQHAAIGAALAARPARPSTLATAALEFEAALRLAPWMDDWRRDACVLESVAGLMARTQGSCNAYLVFRPDDAEIKARLEAVARQSAGGQQPSG